MLAAAIEVFGLEAANKLQIIPISNDTVKRRIINMAVDLEEKVIKQVKKSKYFATQLDESINLSNCAILVFFVRYVNEESIMKAFLSGLKPPERTTSSEIFRSLNSYVQKQGLDGGKWVGVCTGGAADMIGRHSDVTANITEVANKNLPITHCILHWENFFAEKLSPELNHVLNSAVKIVNNIRGGALNSRLFEALCDSIVRYHLLFHAEVRWLLRRRVLTRLFELKEAKQFFVTEYLH